MSEIIGWIILGLVALYFLAVLLPDFVAGGPNPTHGAGKRGFDALKTLRMDLFKHEWERVPESTKTDPKAADLVAERIAQFVNHSTGAGVAGYGKSRFGSAGLIVGTLPRGRSLVGIQGVFLLAGLVATAVLPVSKLHLLWIVPVAFYIVPLTPLNPLTRRGRRAQRWGRPFLGPPLRSIAVFKVPKTLMPSSDPTTQEELDGLYWGILDKIISGFSPRRILRDAVATSRWGPEIVRWAILNVRAARYAPAIRAFRSKTHWTYQITHDAK